jgi:hypothetical protein
MKKRTGYRSELCGEGRRIRLNRDQRLRSYRDPEGVRAELAQGLGITIADIDIWTFDLPIWCAWRPRKGACEMCWALDGRDRDGEPLLEDGYRSYLCLGHLATGSSSKPGDTGRP